MARFATGKHAFGISDRSGMKYRYRDLKKEWNGSLVGPDEFEAKHPQLGPFRTVSDAEALRAARPSRTENDVEVLLVLNPVISSSSGSGVITVREFGPGRTTGDTVRFRTVNGFDGFTKAVLEQSAGYSITVVTTDTYTFTANGQTATIGGIVGGGSRATAGPITVSA